MDEVAIVGCENYEAETVQAAMARLLAPLGGLDWVRAGMTVGIKANLVAPMKAERAATTHPAVLAALTGMLVARGARVIVGDSPGGLYTAAYLNHVYHVTGLRAVEEAGGELNRDFTQEVVSFPQGKVARSFAYTSWLSRVDAVVNVCKLKTHGMMGMSAAAKNLFGVVPGTLKPEYHVRFSDHADFARMLVDLNDYVRPVLSVCDAVVGMEGNGPTAGTPRPIGALLASPSPHKLDLCCARVLGLTRENVPTLQAAFERGYIPETAEEVSVFGDLAAFAVGDFRHVAGETACPVGQGMVKGLFWRVAKKLLVSRPQVHARECIGCGKCEKICPRHTITIKNKKAIIRKKDCIRCFCCQEFCPVGAMKVRRSPVARLLQKM